MIFEKTLMTLAAAAAIAAAAGVAVVAAAFALYALLAPQIGNAGAAAAVAAAAALLAVAGGLLAKSRAKPRRRLEPEPEALDSGLIWRVVEMAKQRPLLAAGAALAAGVFALRNPVMVAAVVKAFMDAAPGSDRRREP